MSEWNGPKMVSPADLESHTTLLQTVAPYIGPMSDASRTALFTALANRKAGITLHVANPEQALWKTGGAVYYDKDQMYLEQASGEVKAVPNTIIPDPIGRRRQGLVPMTTLISSLAKVKMGEIHLIHDAQTYHKRWTTNSAPFKPFRMLEVLGVFKKAIANVPIWRTVVEEGTTLTNERLVEFLYTCLHDMPEMNYFYLHTFVVFELLNIFEEEEKATKRGIRFSLIRKRKGGAFAVPETAYSVLKVTDIGKGIGKQIVSMGYPAVVIFRGGIKPNIKVSPESDMASAIAAKALSITTRGSDKSAMSFLCRNASYSGLANEEVRTLQRCVAMVGGAIEAGVERLDIEIASVSHVPILYTSLNAHFPQKDWVLSMSNEMSMKCASSYYSKITVDRRRDSHLIRYVPYQMKSHSLKTKDGGDELIQVSLRNYHADSTKWRPHAEYSGYSLYTTLFGYYPWAAPKPETTKSSSSSSSTVDRSYQDRLYPERPHYVYRFGQTESFCGIVSTIDSYGLWGQAVTSTPKITPSGKTFVLAHSLQMTPLTKILTEVEWYRRVIESNAAMEAYWMHAKPKFSPISNVLRIPKQGVSHVYNTLGEIEIEEQGDYVDAPAFESEDGEEFDQDLAQQEYRYDDVYPEDDDEDDDSTDDDDDFEEDVEEEEVPEPNVETEKPKSLAQIQAAKVASSSTPSTSVVRPVASRPKKPKRVDDEAPTIVVSADQM